jgi:hypothetical protein
LRTRQTRLRFGADAVLLRFGWETTEEINLYLLAAKNLHDHFTPNCAPKPIVG